MQSTSLFSTRAWPTSTVTHFGTFLYFFLFILRVHYASWFSCMVFFVFLVILPKSRKFDSRVFRDRAVRLKGGRANCHYKNCLLFILTYKTLITNADILFFPIRHNNCVIVLYPCRTDPWSTSFCLIFNYGTNKSAYKIYWNLYSINTEISAHWAENLAYLKK